MENFRTKLSRSDFETEEPCSGHEKRFLEKLDKSKKRKRILILLPYAAILILLMASLSIVFNNGSALLPLSKKQKISSIETKFTKSIDKKMQDLSGRSNIPDFEISIIKHYLSQYDAEANEIKSDYLKMGKPVLLEHLDKCYQNKEKLLDKIIINTNKKNKHSL